MAPEHALRGHLSDKADVYSYGVLLLEIISGKNNTSYDLDPTFSGTREYKLLTENLFVVLGQNV
ncbi:putative protein kinase RLK-Pelle-DLSV family [Helianthus annuus]|nr:putative protein kinase RLK-Pelle-DLSV family [Helianthus annuus]